MIRSPVAIHSLFRAAIACALLIFSPRSATADPVWNLTDINNAAFGSSVISDSITNQVIRSQVNATTPPFAWTGYNTITLGGHLASGEASSSFHLFNGNKVLMLDGGVSARGETWQTGGAAGSGQAVFSATQDFGPDLVQVHIIGTMHRGDDLPLGTPVETFNFGGYQQLIQSQVNTTIHFNDTVTLTGNVFPFNVNISDSQPTGPGFTSTGGVATYHIVMTVTPFNGPVPQLVTPPDDITTVGHTYVVLNNVTQSGTFASQFFTPATASDLETAIGTQAASQINFPLAGQTPQLWDLHYDGAFQDGAEVMLHFDPSLLTSDSLPYLGVEHYVNGAWVLAPDAVVNVDDGTISFTADSLSPFALTLVPEPSSLLLATLPLAAFALRRPRRGTGSTIES